MGLWYSGFVRKSINISEELHTRLKVYCARRGETVAGKISKILTEVLDKEDKLAQELLQRETVSEKKTIKESNEEIKNIEESVLGVPETVKDAREGLTKERGELNGGDYV